MRRVSIAVPVLLGCVLAAGAGCNSTPEAPAPAPNGSSATPTGGTLGEAPTTPAATTKPAANNPPAAASWPTPEDCVSYNPQNVTVHYEAGLWAVIDGSKQVMLLPGGPSDEVGQQGLALAKRFNKHCFLGRTNTREERNSYIFDYWRNATGATPKIEGEEDLCSDYDRGNLTVENMGDGNGWRVKDHDHVLHLFDNEKDARNGKLVLAKYSHICFLGNGGDDNAGQNQVSYSR